MGSKPRPWTCPFRIVCIGHLLLRVIVLTEDSKIENFIRTKYESKRWVMEGGIPDPSTLDDSDDDNVVSRSVTAYDEGCQAKSNTAFEGGSRET